MRNFIVLSFVLILAAGCNPSDDAVSAAGDDAKPAQVADVAKTFKTLRLITKEPVFVDAALARQCAGVTQEQVEAAQKTSGPHANTAVRIYMNEAAAETFQKGTTPYPVGSIVVKEKMGMPYSADGKHDRAERTPDGVGGMIKRAPGFDPDHGDWEYFYFVDPAKIENGKIATCVKCHTSAATKDYVFGNWAKPQE